MKNKAKYYREFGSFNQGSIIISPVVSDRAHEILLSLRISGRGRFEFESVLALVNGRPLSSCARRVYKGICRFGSDGKTGAGVHTLTILEDGSMVIRHSPSPTLKEVVSQHIYFQQQQPSMLAANAACLPGAVQLPPDIMLLRRDSDNEENCQNISPDTLVMYRSFLVQVLPEPSPSKASLDEDRSEFKDETEDEGLSSTLLYISPEISPRHHDTDSCFSSDKVLSSTGIQNMLNK